MMQPMDRPRRSPQRRPRWAAWTRDLRVWVPLLLLLIVAKVWIG